MKLLQDSAASQLVDLAEVMAHLCDHWNTIWAFMGSTALDLEAHDHQIKHSQCQVGIPKLQSLLASSLWGAVKNIVCMVDEFVTSVKDSAGNAGRLMEMAVQEEIACNVDPVCAHLYRQHG